MGLLGCGSLNDVNVCAMEMQAIVVSILRIELQKLDKSFKQGDVGINEFKIVSFLLLNVLDSPNLPSLLQIVKDHHVKGINRH